MAVVRVDAQAVSNHCYGVRHSVQPQLVVDVLQLLAHDRFEDDHDVLTRLLDGLAEELRRRPAADG